MAAPALRLIESTTGEVFDGQDDLSQRIVALEHDLDNVEIALRKERAKVRRLEADKEREREVYVLRSTVEAIFEEWREVCRHPRSKLTPERFDAIRVMIEHRYNREQFRLAIAGAHFEPFCKPRRNGTIERFDDISLICRDGVHFERFCNRAPRRVV